MKKSILIIAAIFVGCLVLAQPRREGTTYLQPGMVYTAGTGITITGTVISASGGAETTNYNNLNVTNAVTIGGTNVTDKLASLSISQITIPVHGNGAALVAGGVNYTQIQFNCIIVGWTLLSGDVAGDIQFDLWVDTYANYPPVVGDTIITSGPPLLSAAIKNTASNVSGWETNLVAGDCLAAQVASSSTLTNAILILKVLR